ncbi:MAG TPA: beta-ketoacyl-ACP synthase III [candidate division Zixibacteria bacterium]|nr:beta-ketoacyl-ACP synthase III [candidate division Zixibacteria bacterium]
MERKIRARIIGTGSYTPPQVMTNADFERIVETSDEWITTRTGIKERRIANGVATSDMAVAASRAALDMARVANEDIEMVILATVTPDYRLPSAACVVQEKMNFPNAAAFDVVAACAGFINGLSIASSYIENGNIKKALVIGVEKLSAFTNYKDRNTCVLFGDAAGAVVVSAEEGESGVLSSYIKSDGKYRTLLWAEIGGSLNPYTESYEYDGRDKIMMNGSDVFKIAVKEMGNAAVKVIENAGLKASDISLIVPHQANIRIVEALAKRLKLDMDKVFLNIEKYGNTSAASVPLALDQANRTGRLKQGDYIVMVAFGGGLTWGASLVRW